MATCANCIHHSLCDYNTNISGNGKVRLVYAEGADVKCSFFQNTADVVPKSEAEKWYYEYHAIKDELKREKMEHKATEKLADKYCVELQTAKSEVESLIIDRNAARFGNDCRTRKTKDCKSRGCEGDFCGD